jgi:hypothetical protein
MVFTNRKHRHLNRPGWHLAFLAILFIAGLCWVAGLILAHIEHPKSADILHVISIYLLWIAGVTAIFALLQTLLNVSRLLKLNSEKMENTIEMLSRQNNLLAQVAQAARLSDTAKEIVFHDTEQMELGEAVLTKLHQHDFEASIALIDSLAKQPKYTQMAASLKRAAEKYRSATEEGRVSQIIAHIEYLFDQKLWIQAAAQIDNLIKTFPYSDKAKTMPARLRERKDRQKRELLAAWDLAVREKNTDRSLEILKELDLYLTPNEALALRESASSVFRTKLHNLGVEFSFAVTEQDWKKAHETGRKIVQDFPNSRMAAEIRSRMDILAERAKSNTRANG